MEEERVCALLVLIEPGSGRIVRKLAWLNGEEADHWSAMMTANDFDRMVREAPAVFRMVVTLEQAQKIMDGSASQIVFSIPTKLDEEGVEFASPEDVRP